MVASSKILISIILTVPKILPTLESVKLTRTHPASAKISHFSLTLHFAFAEKKSGFPQEHRTHTHPSSHFHVKERRRNVPQNPLKQMKKCRVSARALAWPFSAPKNKLINSPRAAQWGAKVTSTAVSAVKWKLFRQLFSIWRPYFNRQLVRQKAEEILAAPPPIERYGLFIPNAAQLGRRSKSAPRAPHRLTEHTHQNQNQARERI
jgi:hypothetical protein